MKKLSFLILFFHMTIGLYGQDHRVHVLKITGHATLSFPDMVVRESIVKTPNRASDKPLKECLGVNVSWHEPIRQEYVFPYTRFYNELYYAKQAIDYGVSQYLLKRPEAVSDIFVVQGLPNQRGDKAKPLNAPDDDPTDPNNYSEYAATVLQAINHRKEFSRFEVLNEPNGFWKGNGYFQPEELAACLSAVYDLVKKNRPDVELYSGGLYTIVDERVYNNYNMVDVGLAYFLRFHRWVARNRGAYNYPMDGMNFHSYFRNGTDPHKAPAKRLIEWEHYEEFKANVQLVRRYLDKAGAERGKHIPMILGETGYTTQADHPFYAPNRSFWTLESVCIALQMGFDRVYLYRMQDTNNKIWQSETGLIDVNGQPKQLLLDIARLMGEVGDCYLVEYQAPFAFFVNETGNLYTVVDLEKMEFKVGVL